MADTLIFQEHTVPEKPEDFNFRLKVSIHSDDDMQGEEEVKLEVWDWCEEE